MMKKIIKDLILYQIRHHWAFICWESADAVKKSESIDKAVTKLINIPIYWENKKSPAESEYLKEFQEIMKLVKFEAKNELLDNIQKRFWDGEEIRQGVIDILREEISLEDSKT